MFSKTKMPTHPLKKKQPARPEKKSSTPKYTSTTRGDSWWVRATRGVVHLLLSDPFPEAYQRALKGCQTSVITGRRIGITSPLGGAGASSTVALLGHQLANGRKESILAVDVLNRDGATLRRLGPRNPRKVSDERGLALLSELMNQKNTAVNQNYRTFSDEINRYLRYIPWGESEEHLDDKALLHNSFQFLSEKASVALLDLPMTEQVINAFYPGLHALIVPIPMYPAAIDVSEAFCKYIHERFPHIGIIPILVDSIHASPKQIRATKQAVRQTNLRTYLPASRKHYLPELSFDAHVATGGRLNMDLLSERLQLQTAQLGATVLAVAKAAS